MKKETEFYKSIPIEIRGKLQEYIEKYYKDECEYMPPFKSFHSFSEMFYFSNNIEGHRFWQEHNRNGTWPTWSEELNRFINLPNPIENENI